MKIFLQFFPEGDQEIFKLGGWPPLTLLLCNGHFAADCHESVTNAKKAPAFQASAFALKCVIRFHLPLPELLVFDTVDKFRQLDLVRGAAGRMRQSVLPVYAQSRHG